MPPTTENGASVRAPKASVPNGVLVWDDAVRVFHWMLVAGVVAAWISGGTGERLHEIIGYTVAGLIGFRIVWGFIGTKHARFGDFVAGPKGVFVYLRSLVRRRPEHFTGHNPAGAAMILLLIAVLATLCITGMMMQSNRFFGIDWVEQIHKVAANSLLVLVPLHVLGALVSSWLHQENLIRSMFTGRKPAPKGIRPASRQERHRFLMKGEQGVWALLILAAVGAAYGWFSTAERALAANAPVGLVEQAPAGGTASPPARAP